MSIHYGRNRNTKETRREKGLIATKGRTLVETKKHGPLAGRR